MSGPSVQLSFTLRTSPNVKTVHLLGSWDGYKSQLPLSATKDGKAGSWKGTFRFQGSHALQLGTRYWYYYIVDGYHVSHDPAQDYTTEKTTGRKLNVLDVPGKSGSTSSSKSKAHTSSSYSKSNDLAQGRSLSPGKIHHPRPSKPYASRQLREADYSRSPISDDDLTDRFASARLSDRHDGRHSYAPSPESSLSSSSGGSTFSSARSGGSSPRSSSSVSSVCTCERFGITKSGARVRLDCGGSRCGYSSSDCSESEEDESDFEEDYHHSGSKSHSHSHSHSESKSRAYGSRRNGTYVSAGRR